MPMYCSNCGQKNQKNDSYCVSCGTLQKSTSTVFNSESADRFSETTKSPVLAMVLSLIIVGLGQFYNGQMKRGAVMLVVAIVGGAISATLIWWFAALWSAVDAYNFASKT